MTTVDENSQEEIQKVVYNDQNTNIERYVKGNIIILKLTGKYTSRVKERILQLIGNKHLDLALELHGVSPIDLSFASFLRSMQEYMRSKKGSLLLIKPSARLMDMLNMCYGERVFNIIADERELEVEHPPDAPAKETVSSESAESHPTERREIKTIRRERSSQIVQFRREVLKTEAREKSLDIARERVDRLLPQHPPEIPGIDIAFAYRPSDKVGGDFFNFINLGQNRWSVLIGDISGHGIEAAVLTGMAKKALDIWSRILILPDRVIKQANRDIYPDLDENTFITLSYGIIDSSSMTFTYARAGHSFPIVFNPYHNKQPESVSSRGMSIGLDVTGLFDKVLEVKTISMQPGDRILFYTDGLTEAADPRNTEFGVQRLLNILTHNPGNTAQDTITNVMAKVDEFSGSKKHEDDITVICIHCAI
ncbi:MAG: PP2C family protein-serine/threonine phosphatase [Planctomycetota bacterium]